MDAIKEQKVNLPACEGDVVNREFAAFNLSGEYMAALKDKSFEVLGAKVVLMKDLDEKDKMIEKVVLTVKLSNKTELQYFPNKTSQKTIVAKRGYRFSEWIGFKGVFYTENMKVGKDKRDVIYIVE